MISNNHRHTSTQAQQRQRRVRAVISGTLERPRVSIFRSNQHTYVQVIDDQAGKTVAAGSDLQLPQAQRAGTKLERARQVARQLADQLKKRRLKRLVLDRGSYRYHGRVAAIAQELRQAGLEF